jgi:uncharacterized membrane protein YtjA (UPF0391 family)
VLCWAFLFLVAAMVVGFSTAAVATAAVAKVLFLIFLTLFVMTLATQLTRSTS